MHVNGLMKILKQPEDNSAPWVLLMTGHGSWLHRIPNTIDGINISFCSSIKMVWLTVSMVRSTGARKIRPLLQMNR